jgi:ATP-dependent exoDNAse (exonuclease V) beta subunit
MRQPGAPHPALVVAPVAGTGAEPNALYQWLESLEVEKQGQERRRLLYVAATRAKRWLHLFGTCQLKEQEEGGPTLVRPASSVALGMLWPVVERAFAARLAITSDIKGEVSPDIAREPPLRRLPLAWRMPEPDSPRIASTCTPAVTAQPPVEFDWATETARHVGTVVHRELQRIARYGAAGGGRAAVTRRRYVDELAELGVPAERRPEAAERIASAVSRTLQDERGRWLLDARHTSSANELALTGRIDGTTVSVVIDRTFVDEAGIRWIVDYKSSSHEGADLDGFLASEQERYRPQLERYASLMRHLGPEPIRLGLYFPLLSAWRSWLPPGR